jgi:hypothetical protein
MNRMLWLLLLLTPFALSAQREEGASKRNFKGGVVMGGVT